MSTKPIALALLSYFPIFLYGTPPRTASESATAVSAILGHAALKTSRLAVGQLLAGSTMVEEQPSSTSLPRPYSGPIIKGDAKVSGNGQLLCLGCPGPPAHFAPLVVVVTDQNGIPLPGVLVTWTVTQLSGGGLSSSVQSTTDSAGRASYNTLQPSLPAAGHSFAQAQITATVASASVQFIETTVTPTSATGLTPVQISTTSLPTLPLTGTAGSVSRTPIIVRVTTRQGNLVMGLPGIAVQLVSGVSGANVTCVSDPNEQSGLTLTDSTGTATCIPVFGTTIGAGTYQLSVGGTYTMFPLGPLTVGAGAPSLITVLSGSHQTANVGFIAPLPLIAEVHDLGGNAVSGAVVVWSVVPANSAVLTNTTTISDSAGDVSTQVTPSAPGVILVTAAVAGNEASRATFTVAVNAQAIQFRVVSGNSQVVSPGTAFAPLVVQVTNGGSPVANVPITFVASNGGITLSATVVNTNTEGQAQITVTDGVIGTVTVTATVEIGSGSLTQVFVLTLIGAPQIFVAGFVNAAGGQGGFISPCSLVTIYGGGLATGLQGFVSAFIEPPNQMAGVSVQFGNEAAPVLSVVNENELQSVTVQVPCDIALGSVPVTITTSFGSTTVQNVPIIPNSPGIFQSVMSDGKLRAVLVRPDGSFVSPDNPARRGEIIRMYATGLGQTNPPITTGRVDQLVADTLGNLTPQIMDTVNHVVVGVNNAGVHVLYARYAWNMIGVYEVAFEVPSDTATGNDVAFAIAVYQDGETSLIFGNPSLIPIE